MTDEREQTKPALVIFDSGEAWPYGRGPDGKIDYSCPLPWPTDWPSYINGEFLKARKIGWIRA